jgi:hypothetical protein
MGRDVIRGTVHHRASLVILLGFAVALTACAFASFRGEDWQELEVGQRAVARSPIALLTQLDPFGLYRPLVNLYHGVQLRLWGLVPFPHFATLLLIWTANTWMVARIARMRGAGSGAAWLVGAAAWVQINTYGWSVLWVASAGRALAVFFWLLALFLHHRAVRLAGLRRPSAGTAALALLALLAGLVCKEEAIVVVPIVIVLEALRWRRLDPAQRRIALRSIVGLTILATIYVALRLTLLPTPTGAPGSYYRLRLGWNWVSNLGFFVLHLAPLAILAAIFARIAYPAAFRGPAVEGERTTVRDAVLEGLAWALVAMQIYLPLGGRSYGFLYAPSFGIAIAVGRGLAWAWSAARDRRRAPRPAAFLAAYWVLAAVAVGIALRDVGWHRYRAVTRDAFTTLDRTLPDPPRGARFVFLDPVEPETASGRSLFNMVFDNVPLSMVRLHYGRPDLTGVHLVGDDARAALADPPSGADVVFLARQGRLTVLSARSRGDP